MQAPPITHKRAHAAAAAAAATAAEAAAAAFKRNARSIAQCRRSRSLTRRALAHNRRHESRARGLSTSRLPPYEPLAPSQDGVCCRLMSECNRRESCEFVRLDTATIVKVVALRVRASGSLAGRSSGRSAKQQQAAKTNKHEKRHFLAETLQLSDAASTSYTSAAGEASETRTSSSSGSSGGSSNGSSNGSSSRTSKLKTHRTSGSTTSAVTSAAASSEMSVARLAAAAAGATIVECNVNDPMSCSKTRLEVCVFRDGAYKCACPTSHDRGADGRCTLQHCVDARYNDCDREATCRPTVDGSFTCACKRGYADLSPSGQPGRNCQPLVNECADPQAHGVSCSKHAICQDLATGARARLIPF